MSRIIEFMGLPGSGKSTLANILLEDIRRRGLAILSNKEAVIRCIKRRDDGVLKNLLKYLPFNVWEPVAGVRSALPELHEFAGQHMPFFELLFNVLNRGPAPPAWRQGTLYAFFKKCAERQLMDRFLASDERVVVEEGFAMGVITLLSCMSPANSCEKEVATYVRHMPVPFAVFYIDIEPSECAARLRLRHEMPLVWADCTNVELLDHLLFNRQSLDQTAVELNKLSVPVCRVLNADCNEGTAVQQVINKGIDWVEQMMVD